MPAINEAQTSFTVDGTKAAYLACPSGGKITVYSNGDTLYYDNASTVTSSSNDGNIATGASATFTSPQYVITAQGTSTRVLLITEATHEDVVVTDDITVADDLTVSDTLTVTGGITQATAPHGFANWQPAAATSGTDTAFADGTHFVTSIFVPVNKTLTGVGYLIGSVGGTDKVYAALYDADGALLANSSVSGGGATVGTAANVQTLAFTSTYAAKGPRIYYVGVSANGATAKLRTVPAHTQSGLYAGSVAQTHGTVAAITEPVTFTADKAPVVFVY
jgi:hypothetical protein